MLVPLRYLKQTKDRFWSRIGLYTLMFVYNLYIGYPSQQVAAQKDQSIELVAAMTFVNRWIAIFNVIFTTWNRTSKVLFTILLIPVNQIRRKVKWRCFLSNVLYGVSFNQKFYMALPLIKSLLWRCFQSKVLYGVAFHQKSYMALLLIKSLIWHCF